MPSLCENVGILSLAFCVKVCWQDLSTKWFKPDGEFLSLRYRSIVYGKLKEIPLCYMPFRITCASFVPN